MKKSILLTLATLLIVTFTLTGCSFGSPSVGVLDVNKIMTDSPKIKGLQDQLNNKGKELSDQLDKEKASLSAEEFQKKQEAAYGEFLKVKQDLEGQIDDSMKQAVGEVAKAKNLSVVLYKNGVAQGGVDVTDEVLAKMQ